MTNNQLFDLKKLVILSEISKGSFGIVYKVQCKETGNIYAAKILIEPVDDFSEDFVNIKREINIISKINHPLILKFIGFNQNNFQNEPHPVIITEFIKNGTLEDLIKSKNNTRINYYWNDTRKLITIYGIASALSYLHSHKIIHRDLKPQNILIDDYLFPKIADFGFSKIKHINQESISYSSNNFKGTPIYMSPEIWSNKEYSEASDVYAFSMIVYQIMTREIPFKNYPVLEILTKTNSGIRPEFNVEIPESYRLLIESCWSQKAEDRPTFNSILNKLKTDPGFITNTIKQQNFVDFTNYIDQFQIDSIIRKAPPNDKFKKIDLNQKEIQFNNDNEMFTYALKLEKGDEMPVDKEESIFYIKLAADKGQIDAMFYFAQKLQKGDGIIMNKKEAAKYFKLAADKGHALAMYYYGMMLYNAEIRQTEKDEVAKYIKMAADKELIIAMCFYAEMLKKGDKVKMNKAESFYYYKKAADNGCIESMKICAMILSKGDTNIGIEQNKIEASRYFKMAADKGDINAMINYSNMLFIGDGIQINKKESAFYCKMAADKGQVEAMNEYGLKLKKGDGVPINLQEATHYFKMGSDKCHIDSMINYAQMLLIEKCTQFNKEKNIDTIKIAADKGQADATNYYALMLFDGDNIPQDKNEASRYFKKSADDGDCWAMFFYGMLLYKGEGIQINKKEGINYIKKSADKGFQIAINFYAFLLMDGKDICPDKQKALRMFKMINNKEKIEELNQSINKLNSLQDFEILEEQVSKPNIKKGYVKVTGQPIVAKYTNKNNINHIKEVYKNLVNCCHPSIQKVVGFFNPSNSNVGVLITPFYNNLSLKEYTISNKCDSDIIFGICTAMKYLEDNNMFHGNLKPSNILIDNNFHPILNNIQMKTKYTDEELKQPELIINYFAPEILQGKEASIKSDVYSFGLILKQMITGKIPYSNLNSKKEIIFAIINDKIEISKKDPKFISIINKCLQHDPEKRPSFNQLYDELETLFIGDSSITDYKNDVISQVYCPISFYRIPKVISMPPDYVLSNQNGEQIQNLIMSNNIKNVFSSINDDKFIKIIMVCGKYQSGKSTFLRTLTGNGAFYSGIGERSTTKGILIDGPYSGDDLIDRIGIEEFKNMFSNEDLQLESDPAIFIIDSQGIGDEIDRDHEKILKRILSFFCSLSDICINITESGEDKKILQKTINIMRQSQMIKFKDINNKNSNSFNKELTKIIFLVKKVNEMNKRPMNSKAFFEKVQRRFQPEWYSYHKVVSDLYIESLTKALPISNLIYYPLNYCCSVWNVIPDIFNFLNSTTPKTKSYISKMINEVSNAFITEFVNELCENEKDLTKQIDIIVNKTIYTITSQINDCIHEIITRDEAIYSISSIIDSIVNIVIPLTIAQNSSISFQDKSQYIYDLKKDINLHLKTNIPEIKKYFKIDYQELSLNNTKFSDTLLMAIPIVSSSLCNPLTAPEVVFTAATIAAVAAIGYLIVIIVRFAKKEIKNNKMISISKRKVRLSIPLLWDNKTMKRISIKKLPSVESVKNLSIFTFWSNKLIIVLENTNTNFMKFIIQSMTGIKTDYEQETINEQESILYGPINKSVIIERTLRDISNFNPDNYNENLLFLYLRGFDINDLNQITNIQSKASFFMSSDKSLIHLPTVKNKIIHMFYSIPNQDISIVKKQECVKMHEKMSKTLDCHDFQIFSWPVLMKNVYNMDDIGPQTNKCLRFAFHQIFKNDE